MRVLPTVALALTFSGCFFGGHCGLQVSSATWTQPGLFEAMADATGPNVTRSLEDPGLSLPFDATRVDATWSDGRLVSISMHERHGFFDLYARLVGVEPGAAVPFKLTVGSSENESTDSLRLFLAHFAYHVTGSEDVAEDWLRAAMGNETPSEGQRYREVRDGQLIESRPLERWARVNATLLLDPLFPEPSATTRGGPGSGSVSRNGLEFQFEFPVWQVVQEGLTIRSDPRGPVNVAKHYGEVSQEVVQADLTARFERLGLPTPSFEGFEMSGAIC